MILHQPSFSLGGNTFQVDIQKGDSWDFHFHKNLEILYVMDGAVECTINNKTDIVYAGEFSMCLSNEIHAGHAIGESVFWACIFSEDYVHSFSKLTKDKEGESFKFQCIAPVKEYLERMFLNTEKHDLFTTKACLYALCGEYLRCVKLIEKTKTKSEAMIEIVDFISQNYTNNIRLSDVANMLNYDYHYVSRLFHQLFNMSFNDFVNVYRLEKAIDLMAKNEKKLLDIAYESGFQSIRTFNKCFRARYGINPTEYKKTEF